MSAGRFFVAPAVLAEPERVLLPPAIANQARNVLRLRAGDTLTLLDGTGMAYTLALTEVGRDQVQGRIAARTLVASEPRRQVSLYQGLLKAAKFEWIIQKGTEIGLSTIVPVHCARSIVGADEVSAAKRARWRTIATEAAEQSDRGRVPEVREPVKFADALAALPPDAVALLAHAGEVAHAGDVATGASLGLCGKHIAPARNRNPFGLEVVHDATVHLFIGPEGGFAPEEVALAQEHGVRLVTLGPRILRAETAALVAATLALAALGELG